MTQLVPVQQKIANVRTLLERSKPQIAMALPRHLTPDRMLRVAMTCVQRNPQLLDCTPTSLVGAIVQAAQLGLEPDGLGARAYLIPRVNRRKQGHPLEANFQPGYQGLMDLARRSKEIAKFEAREVYEGDRFVYSYGLKPTLVHVPGGEVDEKKISHVYAIATLINGVSQFEVMTRAQIDAHRERYSKDSRDESAWSTAWAMMAKKTVIIRLCKYLPASVELQTAVALAEHDEAGIPQEIDAVVLPAAEEGNGAGKPKGALDKLADGLKGKRGAADDTQHADAPSGLEGHPEASESGSVPAGRPAPPEAAAEDEDVNRERGLLIAAILPALQKRKTAEQNRLLIEHLGEGATLMSLNGADVSALADLKAALERK